MNNNPSPIRPKTVKLIAQLLRPLVDESVVSVGEATEIQAQLKHLAAKGTLLPAVEPRLLTQQQVADRLAISVSLLKKLERGGELQGLPRRMVGPSAVRYRNYDVARYIAADDATEEDAETA